MAIKILNRARLQQKINRMPAVVKQEIRSELEKQANIVVAMMKRRAPVKTGAIKNSIGWTWGRPPRGSMILGEIARRLGDELTITIYAGGGNAFYATFVELGTRKMHAQPFFYPVWRAKRKDAHKEIRMAVRNAARNVAKGNNQ